MICLSLRFIHHASPLARSSRKSLLPAFILISFRVHEQYRIKLTMLWYISMHDFHMYSLKVKMLWPATSVNNTSQVYLWSTSLLIYMDQWFISHKNNIEPNTYFTWLIRCWFMVLFLLIFPSRTKRTLQEMLFNISCLIFTQNFRTLH
jgi:hypothetical protein